MGLKTWVTEAFLAFCLYFTYTVPNPTRTSNTPSLPPPNLSAELGPGAQQSVSTAQQTGERSPRSKLARVQGRNFISSAMITSKFKYLYNIDYKYSPGKISNMSPSNNINGFTWNLIWLFLNLCISFFFFFKDHFLYSGELQWRIPFIHSLSNLAVPKPGPYWSGGMASHIWQLIVEDSLFLFFSFGWQFVQISHSKYISGVFLCAEGRNSPK